MSYIRWGERRHRLPVDLAERYRPLHTDCRTRVPLYIGEIGIAIPENTASSIFVYLQNLRQFHATRDIDNQQLTKSYENAVAFFMFAIYEIIIKSCIIQKKVVPLHSNMLEDYIIDDRIRYEGHYLRVADMDVQIGGVAGAALLSALLVDTEEGARRGIAIDSEAEQMAWIKIYEREVRRDEWGLIGAEIELLNNAYIDLATSETEWTDICPNVRLLDLAFRLVTTYMHHLTIETFYHHIWEYQPWEEPFAQWLLNAAQAEPRRQLFLQTDWIDPVQVNALYEEMQRENAASPTFVFIGEEAEDIYKRYFTWLWRTYQAHIREIPGEQPRAARHRNYVVEQETNWVYLKPEIDALNEKQQRLWAQWMLNWQKYISKQLKPEKPVLFWEKEVSEKRQKQLTQFLRIQEKEWDYFKCLSAAIYALRQLGYVRRACSVRDITRWMTEQLTKDYTTRNNRDQFVRAWKELGRYTPEVRDYIEQLNLYGITRLDGKK